MVQNISRALPNLVCQCHDITSLTLTENLIQTYQRKTGALNQILQNTPAADTGQLILISNHNNSFHHAAGSQQVIEQPLIHHGKFVNNQ